MIARRSRFAVLGSALLLAGLLTGPLMPKPTFAHIVICRDDPVVSLWNLGQLDLTTTISDSRSDVQQVVFEVHAPVGIHELAVVNLDPLFGLKSSVRFYSDNTPNTFDVYTTVYTGHGPVHVTAGITVVSLLNLNLGISSTSGLSGTAIHTHFRPLL